MPHPQAALWKQSAHGKLIYVFSLYYIPLRDLSGNQIQNLSAGIFDQYTELLTL